MNLRSYLDVAKLNEHIKNGYVASRKHPELELWILSYTKKATLDWFWDDVIIKCRGLIIDAEWNIISRAFEKFFDVATQERPETWLYNLPQTQPVVLDKIDGNLGILYDLNGHTGVASKGSFDSPHARWATDWYKKRCPNPIWLEGHTPVFEMICEDVQVHPVSYGGTNELILTALINTETGEEADYNTLYHYAYLNGLKVPTIYGKSVGDALSDNPENAEGYVLSWPRPGQTPLKVKVKFDSFREARKLFYQATPKDIIKALRENDWGKLNTLFKHKNRAVATRAQDAADKARKAFTFLYEEALDRVSVVRLHGLSRSDAAKFFKDTPHLVAICFAVLNAKDPAPYVWNAVEKHIDDFIKVDVVAEEQEEVKD